jgi:hypothetical protein
MGLPHGFVSPRCSAGRMDTNQSMTSDADPRDTERNDRGDDADD